MTMGAFITLGLVAASVGALFSSATGGISVLLSALLMAIAGGMLYNNEHNKAGKKQRRQYESKFANDL